MSLATRCTECGTVFRVVQDQLKVSEGWVRCGRCSAVFNALENLCELDADGAEPPRQDHPHDAPALEPRAYAHHAAVGHTTHEIVFDDGHVTRDDEHEPTHSFPDSEQLPDEPGPHSLPPMADDGLPAAIVTFSSESLPDDDPPLRPPPVAAPPPPPAAPPAPAAPQFIQAAERAAFWRRPAVRSGLVAAALLLTATLVLQVAVAGRDWLSAHVAGTRPLLHAACAVAGCQIEPLKRIAQLSVDSSGLTRLDSAAAYRLSVVLRNRADTAVAVPALDLSLTDGAGQLVARRVLRAAELGLPSVIEAGQELPLQALLSTGERRVSGYTVELFYP